MERQGETSLKQKNEDNMLSRPDEDKRSHFSSNRQMTISSPASPHTPLSVDAFGSKQAVEEEKNPHVSQRKSASGVSSSLQSCIQTEVSVTNLAQNVPHVDSSQETCNAAPITELNKIQIPSHSSEPRVAFAGADNSMENNLQPQIVSVFEDDEVLKQDNPEVVHQPISAGQSAPASPATLTPYHAPISAPSNLPPSSVLEEAASVLLSQERDKNTNPGELPHSDSCFTATSEQNADDDDLSCVSFSSKTSALAAITGDMQNTSIKSVSSVTFPHKKSSSMCTASANRLCSRLTSSTMPTISPSTNEDPNNVNLNDALSTTSFSSAPVSNLIGSNVSTNVQSIHHAPKSGIANHVNKSVNSTKPPAPVAIAFNRSGRRLNRRVSCLTTDVHYDGEIIDDAEMDSDDDSVTYSLSSRARTLQQEDVVSSVLMTGGNASTSNFNNSGCNLTVDLHSMANGSASSGGVSNSNTNPGSLPATAMNNEDFEMANSNVEHNREFSTLEIDSSITSECVVPLSRPVSSSQHVSSMHFHNFASSANAIRITSPCRRPQSTDLLSKTRHNHSSDPAIDCRVHDSINSCDLGSEVSKSLIIDQYCHFSSEGCDSQVEMAYDNDDCDGSATRKHTTVTPRRGNSNNNFLITSPKNNRENRLGDSLSLHEAIEQSRALQHCSSSSTNICIALTPTRTPALPSAIVISAAAAASAAALSSVADGDLADRSPLASSVHHLHHRHYNNNGMASKKSSMSWNTPARAATTTAESSTQKGDNTTVCNQLSAAMVTDDDDFENEEKVGPSDLSDKEEAEGVFSETNERSKENSEYEDKEPQDNEPIPNTHCQSCRSALPLPAPPTGCPSPAIITDFISLGDSLPEINAVIHGYLYLSLLLPPSLNSDTITCKSIKFADRPFLHSLLEQHSVLSVYLESVALLPQSVALEICVDKEPIDWNTAVRHAHGHNNNNNQKKNRAPSNGVGHSDYLKQQDDHDCNRKIVNSNDGSEVEKVVAWLVPRPDHHVSTHQQQQQQQQQLQQQLHLQHQQQHQDYYDQNNNLFHQQQQQRHFQQLHNLQYHQQQLQPQHHNNHAHHRPQLNYQYNN
eukprot:GDKJ01019792.1.p1 GENE.GDKJ01019792.1~~GDKJ01019792.1.p1  ORF type:complete len:1280 (+),score=364.01 GDKJ01019792.1:577-3840(+)